MFGDISDSVDQFWTGSGLGPESELYSAGYQAGQNGQQSADLSWISPVTGGVSTILTALGFGAKPAALPAAPPQVIVQQSAIPTWVPWVAVGGIGLYLLTSKGKRK
jgi:hypothetical protein